MPSNKPFIPEVIERFLAFINTPRRTAAEEALDAATANMTGTISVIEPNQPIAVMEVPTAEANFLAMQTRLLKRKNGGPMKAIDVGTFTGRSALAIAREMPEGSKVITCEIEHEKTAESLEIAKKHWALANQETPGITDRIELRLGAAKDKLQALLDKDEAGTFDIIFIDADKPNYPDYYKMAVDLLRPGGLVILDNMLWSGRVADPAYYEKKPSWFEADNAQARDKSAEILRGLNISISQDPRVEAVLLGFEDGVMVAEKCGEGHVAKLSKRQSNGYGRAA